jgi:hypothetical protein
LFLGYNDLVNAFSDNSGTFTVQLSVTPIPEPSTFAMFALGLSALAVRIARQREL